MRISSVLGLFAVIAAYPGVSNAAVYKQEGCQVVVPSGWVESRSRVATPDKKIWASLMQAPSTAEAVQIELGLKAAKVSEDGHMVLLVSSASYAGLTNKQYHAITKTTPSCIADVTAPAGPMEATAKQVAATVSLAK